MKWGCCFLLHTAEIKIETLDDSLKKKWQKDKSKCEGIQHKLNAALQHTVGIIISDFYFFHCDFRLFNVL